MPLTSPASDEVIQKNGAHANLAAAPSSVDKNSDSKQKPISELPRVPMRPAVLAAGHGTVDHSDDLLATTTGTLTQTRLEDATAASQCYKRIAIFINVIPTPSEVTVLNTRGITPVSYKLSNITRKPISLLNTIKGDIRCGRVRWVHGVINGNRCLDHGWIAQICRSAHRGGSPWSLSILGDIKQGDAVD